MIESIYIEENIRDHTRVHDILASFPSARTIICGRYGEVFNPKSQNFRLQKLQPALILAEKHQNFVHKVPDGYGIGATHNYYFSHMLNCVYDCRYCFLQGMYQSANYVLFVNYEDFQSAIKQTCLLHHQESAHFFSGYDCDSLALEPVTRFAEDFLTFMSELPNAWLELRTKSTQIRSLLNRTPHPRCIVAFSLSPESVINKVEAKTPQLQRRLEAIIKLQQNGWPIGLRFDPLIYQSDYQEQYQLFFERVFKIIDRHLLHSVSLGVFRLPEAYFKKIHKLYPDEKLFASPLTHANGMTSYPHTLELEMMDYCKTQLLNYISADKLFPCNA